MPESTTMRVYEKDKEKIAELSDDDRPWPARVQQVLELVDGE